MILENNLQDYAAILEAHRHLHALQYQHWVKYQLFTPVWWTLVAVGIVPWIIWWKLVDRQRIAVIFSYGMLIMYFIITMDALGIVYQRWIYPIKVLPIIPHETSLDWGMLPVIHMLIYQYFPRWRSFLIAETATAAALAFLGETFAEQIGVYFVLNWKHIWSFPIYIAKAIVTKLLIEKLLFRPKKRW